jgi:hypothetical protein
VWYLFGRPNEKSFSSKTDDQKALMIWDDMRVVGVVVFRWSRSEIVVRGSWFVVHGSRPWSVVRGPWLWSEVHGREVQCPRGPSPVGPVVAIPGIHTSRMSRIFSQDVHVPGMFPQKATSRPADQRYDPAGRAQNKWGWNRSKGLEPKTNHKTQ